MNHLSLPQEFNDIIHIRIIRKAQDVVISFPGFLFGGKVFTQIRNRITGYLDAGCGPGISGGSGRLDTGSMIHKIRSKGRVFDLLFIQIAGQLMDQGTNHLQVPQFFGTDRGIKMDPAEIS